jgi:hypothetical protein
VNKVNDNSIVTNERLEIIEIRALQGLAVEEGKVFE